MPYITLGVTGGVVTQVVPSADDGVSLPINVHFPSLLVLSFNHQSMYVVYSVYIDTI